MFNESFVSLIFESGQRVSLPARGLSIVINGVGQAVTGGSVRQYQTSSRFYHSSRVKYLKLS